MLKTYYVIFKLNFDFLEYCDCSTALKNIKENYDEMTYLPISLMLPKLYSKDIITFKEKEKITACSAAQTDQMEYFLDHIIIPSLTVDVSIKFTGLLEVMKESGNSILISMAKKLGNYLNIYIVMASNIIIFIYRRSEIIQPITFCLNKNFSQNFYWVLITNFVHKFISLSRG